MPLSKAPSMEWSSQGITRLLQKNKEWAEREQAADPEYFSRLKDHQQPEYLWIGCADSRVPANLVVGLAPGEMFVHRNVGNQVAVGDMNAMACLEYAVGALGVRHIIVSGHYNCGAVRAALTMPTHTEALVNFWIHGIREVRDSHSEELLALRDHGRQVDRLCELNVLRQVYNVCTSPVVQGSWQKGQLLAVHGIVYSLENGRITDLVPPITSVEDLEAFATRHEQFKVSFGRAHSSKALGRRDSGKQSVQQTAVVADATMRTAGAPPS